MLFKKWYLFDSVDATDESRYPFFGRIVNHRKGKEQNCRMRIIDFHERPYLCLFAIKYIGNGEAILYDYGITDMPWETKLSNVLYYFA